LYIATLAIASGSVLSPLFASASFFTLFATNTATPTASTTSYNSQTLPVLASARNIDPRLSAVGGGDISIVDSDALMAQAGPSGTAADLSDNPENNSIFIYSVHQGDTISGIANMFGVTPATIISANKITGSLTVGQQLIILPTSGVLYTIKKGDTIASIAKAYKADTTKIANFNNLVGDDSLSVGDNIIIPGGQVPATPAQTAQQKHSSTIKKIASGKTKEPYLGGSGADLGDFFSWPVAGGIVTQGLHGWNAVDIGAPRGTTVFAAAGGVVKTAISNGGWNGGYGNFIIVSHPNGTETLYAHLSRVLVSAGDSVSQGDTIGKVGATGEATGPHLHFEVHGAVNPFASMSLGTNGN